MVKTCWTKATIDVNEAVSGLLSCINHGLNAWIEVRKNGDQDYPIMKVNPELDNPFNWEMSYGMPRNKADMEKHAYLNETEKDLTYNWTNAYGTPEAVEIYQKTGEVTPDLFVGIGTSCPVRINDANWYREHIKGDNYKYGFWTTFWKPKKEISTYVVDESIGKVFVVCYDDSADNIPDKNELIRRAGEFLIAYADMNADETADEKCGRLTTISELKKMYHDEYADIEVYEPVFEKYPNHFHTDNCRATNDWDDETKISLYQLMDEADYDATILANSGLYAEFEAWYGSRDAKVLVCMAAQNGKD